MGSLNLALNRNSKEQYDAMIPSCPIANLMPARTSTGICILLAFDSSGWEVSWKS